jgi:hypothetical protein
LRVSITTTKFFVSLLVGWGILIQIGCSQRSSYHVSGKVQYKDGSPITGGVRTVNFEPTASTTAAIRKSATGQIGQDGTFEMYSRKPGDGVIPGKYAVTFVVMDKPMGGKLLIPPKYTSAADSPYEINVDGDKTDLVYEIDKQ